MKTDAEPNIKIPLEEASPRTVLRWLEAKKIILVDVREIIEYEEEHIPGALLSPLSNFDPHKFPKFPGRRVVIHCALGKRSANAARQLIAAGYPADVINMEGGILAWQANGCPTEVQHEDRDELPFVDDKTGKIAMPALKPGAHPGQVLDSEFMRPFGLSRAALADAIKVPPSRIGAIVRGERRITAETAMRLSRYLCTTEEFWLRLQAAHDLTKAKGAFGKQVNAQVKPRRTSTREGGPAPEQA